MLVGYEDSLFATIVDSTKGMNGAPGIDVITTTACYKQEHKGLQGN